MALQRYAEAKALLERAIGMGERVRGSTHPQYGLLLHTRGELAAAMGDLGPAEADLVRALETYDQRGRWRCKSAARRLGVGYRREAKQVGVVSWLEEAHRLPADGPFPVWAGARGGGSGLGRAAERDTP